MKQSFFDKIIEAILSIATFFSGGGAVAPQSTQAPTETAATSYEVYREIVQDTVDELGFYSREKAQADDKSSGLWNAEAIDITGDGADELLIVYVDGDVSVKIYEYENGKATVAWSKVYEASPMFRMGVNRLGDNVYWATENVFNMLQDMNTYTDGRYKTVFRNDIDESRINAEYDNEYEQQLFMLCKEELGLPTDTTQEPIWDIRNRADDELIAELKSRWELDEPTRPVSEILDVIPYYGNRSKCKMTKEMALAYIDALNIEKADAARNDHGIWTMLMELSGDGVPVLAVIPYIRDSGGTQFYAEFTPLFMNMWGWNGTELQRVDFDKDFGGEGAGYYYFSHVNKDAMITVGPRETGRDDVDNKWDLLEYTVSNGQIKLQNKVADASPEQYTALHDADGYSVYYSYLRSFELTGDWVGADHLIAALTEYKDSFTKPIRHEAAVAETAKDEKSNITIDYSDTDNGAKALEKLIKDTKPNNAATSDIAEYVRICIRDASERAVTAKDNTVNLKNKIVKKAAKCAKKEHDKFTKVLNDNSVSLNKSVDEILLITCKGIDISGTVKVVFDNEIVSAMDGTDEIIIALNDRHQIRLDADALAMITDKYPAVTICITKAGDDIYEIKFTDNNGNVITQLDGNIGFVIPAENNMYSVLAQDNNIGCQFDASNNTVMFETSYSGNYTVFENNADISDIEKLSKAHRDAIQFMVSKGYFALDNDSFKPTAATIRYEFAQALTGIFFLHDPNRTETSFKDVPDNSPYLSYVASGEYWDIIEGYDDVTFAGNDNLSYEQAIAMCSRLLMEKKGYTEVKNPDDYLNFTDNAEISDWAGELIALAVREGLIADGGKLDPQGDISKADSALLLYRLFMLIHETEPVAANLQAATNTQVILICSIGGMAVALVGLIAALVIVSIKRKKK